MRAFERAGRASLVVGVAAVLVTGLATSSQAATGTFTYTTGSGVEFELKDPADRFCFTLNGGATGATNETNGTATVYRDESCQDAVLEIGPGQNAIFGRPPKSVAFNV
ncbi:hypothetical protein [Streptomyces caatingaensis]|uniref:Uncharacterized protein n=1 Tax=Streptomyces caatingaensis TaxID=1678637 RepID=A0A0K9XC03_9ACTN|nr:hypothetical protein [Streptomyces caatingaensis]KNB50641.1 hypothetical protein AC230_22225 [Streptomyces caatingaensis]